jgi:hypothetical protein
MAGTERKAGVNTAGNIITSATKREFLRHPARPFARRGTTDFIHFIPRRQNAAFNIHK